jgi:COP9 signalosome complex subunit 6
MTDVTDNPLLSSRPSDTGLTVSLHPLVLLTVSDHVTRHSVRKQKGPIAGALLGQQKGRDITAEYAFATDLVQNPEGQWLFNVSWMEERVQQCK